MMTRFSTLMMALSFASCVGCKANAREKTNVGIACSNDAECGKGLFCQVRLPGGMCTKECAPCPAACSSSCEPGCDANDPVKCQKGCIEVNSTLCPDGAQCANVQYTVNGQSFNDVRCLPECDLERPCRSGYQCVRPSSFNFSVCIPG